MKRVLVEVVIWFFLFWRRISMMVVWRMDEKEESLEVGRFFGIVD